MKRLTYFDGGKWRLKIGDTEYSGEVADRLAAYEETGLEPEDFKQTFSEDTILKLAGQALGITPDRLRELAQTDKDVKIKGALSQVNLCFALRAALSWTRRPIMRLVDADNARECFSGDGVTGAVMQRMFDSLPTIDAVPVVRCRDCKWFNHYTMECESDDVATDHEGGASFSLNFGPDDFCSYGQRKEADHG